MSIASFGELLIDFVALEHGVSVGDASGFKKAPGGAPANVAVAVARLGHPSAFLGQVGNDPFGHHLTGVLAAANVDVSGVRYSEEARTALAFVSLRADGERSFMFYRHPSADMLMRPEDIDVNVITGKEIFHFGSVTMINEPSRSTTLRAAEIAYESGKLISYDPNLRLALWPDADTARQGMFSGLDYATVVKVSEEEVEFMTGSNDVTSLWRNSTRLIAVTEGARGATIYTRTGKHFVPGYKVNAVDTTGAGDGFVAGLLVGILEHKQDYEQHLDDILLLANGVGALTTTQLGAIPALPTRDAVERFIRDAT